MGGVGSGNHWSRGRPTVEGCLALDAVRLMHGRKPLGIYTTGTITWSDALTGEKLSNTGYSLVPDGERMLLKLTYRVDRIRTWAASDGGLSARSSSMAWRATGASASYICADAISAAGTATT